MEVLSEEDEEWEVLPIRKLLTNSVYMLLVFTISSLYFVVSGLQFWTTTYLTTVLETPMNEVFTVFTVTCFSAPAFGVIIGTSLFNSVGGYNTRASYVLAILLGASASMVSLPVPFSDSRLVVYSLFWLIFFFGSMIMAPLVGMMLS